MRSMVEGAFACGFKLGAKISKPRRPLRHGACQRRATSPALQGRRKGASRRI